MSNKIDKFLCKNHYPRSTFTSILLGSISAYGLSLSTLEFGIEYAAAGTSLSISWPIVAALASALLGA